MAQLPNKHHSDGLNWAAGLVESAVLAGGPLPCSTMGLDFQVEVLDAMRLYFEEHLIDGARLWSGTDVLIIGSHSKRDIWDIALGGTARHLMQKAPCTVLTVSPKA